MTRGQSLHGFLTISTELKEGANNKHVVYEETDFLLRTKYLNYTGTEITMVMRNGVRFDLPARTHRTRSQFVVRYEYELTERLKESVRRFLIDQDGHMDSQMQEFKRLFMDAYQEQLHGMVLKIDYEIGLSEIKRAGGSVYVNELDIILSTNRDDLPLHPFSNISLATQETPSNDGHSGLNMYIVDNNDTIGRRYVKLRDRVVCIEDVKDPLKANGLYILYQGVVGSAKELGGTFKEFIEPSAIGELDWVFSTYARALASCEEDREANTSLEIKSMDVESKRMEYNSRALKSQMEIERLEKERETKEIERMTVMLQNMLDDNERRTRLLEDDLKRQYAQLEYASKTRSLESKDYYEDRSHARKDSSEWLKAIPGLVALAGAAFLGFKALS